MCNRLRYLQAIEEKAHQLMLIHCTYDCEEFDNGTFNCDECPIFKEVVRLHRKAESLIKRGE